MNWKDIVKAPPFDVQERSRSAQANKMAELEEELEAFLDVAMASQIKNKPFQNTFTLPMAHHKHQHLVRLARSEEGLKNAIERLYNLKSVEFKRGAVPGYTEGKMAYWIVI